MVNWYMLVLGTFSKHVPKWTKKSRKLVHAVLKGEIFRRESKKRREKRREKKNNNPTGVRLLFI